MMHIFILLILLAIPTAVAQELPIQQFNNEMEAYQLQQAQLAQLAAQYDLTKAITVYSGALSNGWHSYGTIEIPKDWKKVYLIIMPLNGDVGNVAIYAMVNGQEVLTNAPIRSIISVDITDALSSTRTASINIWASTPVRAKVLVAPPNPAVMQAEELNSNIKNTKYILIGLAGIILAAIVVTAGRKRR